MVSPVADAMRERGVPFLFATGYDATVGSGHDQDVPRHKKSVTPTTLVRAIAGG
jgi:hypothetical protein